MSWKSFWPRVCEWHHVPSDSMLQLPTNDGKAMRRSMKTSMGLAVAFLIAVPWKVNAGGCEVVELLSNADLDKGAGVAWVEDGAGFPIILSPSDPTFPLPVTPHTPDFSGWMGGVNSETRSLYQDVLVPAGARDLFVSGFRLIATQETSGVWDIWRATIRNVGNAELEELGSLSNADADSSWLPFIYGAAGDYSGQAIRIHFENTNDATNNTNFFVDSFAATVKVCADLDFINGFEDQGN